MAHNLMNYCGIFFLGMLLGADLLICVSYLRDLVRELRLRLAFGPSDSIVLIVFGLVFSFCMALVNGGVFVLAIDLMGR